VAEIQAVVVVEKFREIEEIEPPDGVGDAFGNAKGPESSMANKDGVDRAAFGYGSEVNLGLSRAATELVIGEYEPDDCPYEPHGASANEGGMPSPASGDRCDEDGGNEGRGIRSGVEETGREGTFFRGEPLCGGLDGSGEVA